MVRDWRQEDVITTVRTLNKKEKLQGLGLTDKGRKLQNTFGREVDAKRPIRTQNGLFGTQNGSIWT